MGPNGDDGCNLWMDISCSRNALQWLQEQQKNDSVSRACNAYGGHFRVIGHLFIFLGFPKMGRPQYASLVLSTLLMLVALAGLGFTLAYLRGSFEEKVTMYFETDNAAGLYEGMKIKYRGFDVGSLKSLELADSGVVSGELLFKQSEARFLRVGAFLKVSKEKIVANELLLDGVDISKNLAIPNTKIQLIRSDVTDDLTKRLDPMLDRFALLLDQLSDPQKGLQPTLVVANLAMRETSETLKATRSTLRDLSQSTNQLPSAINE
uniref:MlaD family protein n=1 Tax=Roseivirga sp. TaxID=1964215 RepID=UPI0040489F8E